MCGTRRADCSHRCNIPSWCDTVTAFVRRAEGTELLKLSSSASHSSAKTIRQAGVLCLIMDFCEGRGRTQQVTQSFMVVHLFVPWSKLKTQNMNPFCMETFIPSAMVANTAIIRIIISHIPTHIPRNFRPPEHTCCHLQMGHEKRLLSFGLEGLGRGFTVQAVSLRSRSVERGETIRGAPENRDGCAFISMVDFMAWRN